MHGPVESLHVPPHLRRCLRTNERPLRFTLDEDTYKLETTEDRWYESGYEFFKVFTRDSKQYLLRYDQQRDEWTLQSDFDGAGLLARPGIEL